MRILKDLRQVNHLKENQIVLDIETTGVSREFSSVVVVGILESNGVFRQFFIENTADEKKLLEELCPYLDGKHIISYNGENFDLPFLKSRYAFYGITSFVEESGFDIYRYFVSNKLLTTIEHFSLREIERYSNIERFENFEKTTDIKFYETIESSMKSILIHNKYDVINTEKILDIVQEIEENKKFEINILNKDIHVSIQSITIDKNMFKIVLACPKPQIPYHYQNNIYQLDWDESLIIKFNIIEGYIAENHLGQVHVIENPNFIVNNKNYNVPKEFIIVFDGRYIIENIKEIVKYTVSKFLN